MNIRSQNITTCIFLILGFITISGCDNGAKKHEEETTNKKQYLPDKNEVNILLLNQGGFKKEIVSNGRLVALEKSNLKFKVSEELQQLYVKNGDYVKRGQVLASLNNYTFQQKVNKAQLDLKQATLNFKDLQIRRGFNPNTPDNIPQEEYDKMAIKSGYKNSKHQLETAQFDLRATKLIAPFNGKVANIDTKIHEQVNSNKPFLTLINDTVFEVVFQVIESELNDINVNDVITIQPFATTNAYTGRITTINPQVEKDGTILISATVKNDGNLLEGMNVKVFIQKDVPNQFVVPKAAVVLRDNHEVLFKVQQGKAFWTYVQTIYENSKQYAVIPHPDKSSATLKVGDTIVVSNNLNLAHDSEVAIKIKN
ncbi:efflux RND transporter periplasmic adaptor subunit [Seonamhaeicola sediminis]|uniref:Efflux RND transporter periplasmic adaptor subunit n=1 Tax=Seonamhaeicola sediminis TaxID=2528206 RepID=A0A562YB96_9FLAO|nr:efflux RND transporter periplasmic adaptor subunit [Seonamhaeicola sediminis]TWO31562.1 efflux RND transporter periplasmic adaptor subunit [Seonamhaeicola sediminis]